MQTPEQPARVSPPSTPETFLFQHGAAHAPDTHHRRLQRTVPSRGSVSWNVLVAVSDPIECARLGRILCRFGHAVSLVCDARDAAAILAHAHFDLVLIEIDPPSRAAHLVIEKLLPTITIAVGLLASTPTTVNANLANSIPRLAAVIGKPASEAALSELLQQKLPGVRT